jgi:putative ABC transport system ATP-binding protein
MNPQAPSITRDSLVQIRDLTYRFDADMTIRPVLDNVNFELRAGEFVLLTGPSGAGKTTLLTIVGALRSIQAGEVLVLGKELRSATESAKTALRRQIGFIFQNHHLFDELTARETLELAMRLMPEKYTRADYRKLPDEWLARLGVGHRRNARPSQMSTGQRQRVAIARALINSPALVLADEPTASLDAESAAVSLACLREIVADTRSSVLMISHDPRHCEMAHRVVTMVDGAIASIEAGDA